MNIGDGVGAYRQTTQQQVWGAERGVNKTHLVWENEGIFILSDASTYMQQPKEKEPRAHQVAEQTRWSADIVG